MIEIGKYYKHIEYHSFIKVKNIIFGYYSGTGFHRNENGCIGIMDTNIIEPNDYKEISKTEFLKEYKIIENLIKKRLPECTPKIP